MGNKGHANLESGPCTQRTEVKLAATNQAVPATADRVRLAHAMAARAIEQDVVNRASRAQLSSKLRTNVSIMKSARIRVAQQKPERGDQLLAARTNRIEALMPGCSHVHRWLKQEKRKHSDGCVANVPGPERRRCATQRAREK